PGHGPWHQACSGRGSGGAVRGPASTPRRCWGGKKRMGPLSGRTKSEPADKRTAGKARSSGAKPERVVIVGGGAAGFAAAEMLRREGFAGSVTLLSSDESAPYDRPNCSKDYLAGNAPEDWMPLKPPEFYAQHAITLELGAEVTAIDAKARQVTLADGRNIAFDKLLLATGA